MTDLTKQLERIKAECRRVIALASAATPGPWETGVASYQVYANGKHVAEMQNATSCERDDDAAFIAESRTITPKAAQATITAIEALEFVVGSREFCQVELQRIVADWFPMQCPKCHSTDVSRGHHDGDAQAPECDYWRCECGEQWGHE